MTVHRYNELRFYLGFTVLTKDKGLKIIELQALPLILIFKTRASLYRK